jgi:hypothetical protein
MSDKTIPLDYANDLLFEMEKAFWDERGKGARFRMTTIGREYFKNKCLPLLQSSELDHILHTIQGVLQGEGIVGQVSYNQDERMIRLSIEGCVHRKIEDRMVSLGIEPFTCMPANLIVLAIEEKLDRPVELAEIKVEGGACQLLLVMFDQRPKIG